MKITANERLNRLTSRDLKSECILFNGKLTNKGYGWFYFEGSPKHAHRVRWMIDFGKIKTGLLVLHKCDVRNCVNINHLFLGTAQENTDDMLSKNRCKSGEFQKAKKLCPKGHEYSGLNLYIQPDGKRCCRTCKRNNLRLSRKRRTQK